STPTACSRRRWPCSSSRRRSRARDGRPPRPRARRERPSPEKKREVSMLFRDRVDAGRRLASALRSHQYEGPIVLGLPRGGVPVAYEVARALSAPLDVWVVRKIGAPMQEELGVGALAEGGEVYLNEGLMDEIG